ncbi:hypothetical protein C8R47DRAFT_1070584 [Mycena vitilis]|nr:hypothetical protein C8R47DRAFT_1070584 [Mycena vitilis]
MCTYYCTTTHNVQPSVVLTQSPCAVKNFISVSFFIYPPHAPLLSPPPRQLKLLLPTYSRFALRSAEKSASKTFLEASPQVRQLATIGSGGDESLPKELEAGLEDDLWDLPFSTRKAESTGSIEAKSLIVAHRQRSTCRNCNLDRVSVTHRVRAGTTFPRSALPKSERVRELECIADKILPKSAHRWHDSPRHHACEGKQGKKGGAGDVVHRVDVDGLRRALRSYLLESPVAAYPGQRTGTVQTETRQTPMPDADGAAALRAESVRWISAQERRARAQHALP